MCPLGHVKQNSLEYDNRKLLGSKEVNLPL
jgi:hypothetical protein